MINFNNLNCFTDLHFMTFADGSLQMSSTSESTLAGILSTNAAAPSMIPEQTTRNTFLSNVGTHS